MAKLDFIFDHMIDSIMDDIPDDMWYNKDGQQFPQDDTTVDESVPSYIKLECLSKW
jgi:hypothetical protein